MPELSWLYGSVPDAIQHMLSFGDLGHFGPRVCLAGTWG